MKKIQFSESKTLKLTNVLKYKILMQEENFDFNVAIEQMQTYIKTKGAMQIGPLIQYTRTFLNDNNVGQDAHLLVPIDWATSARNIELSFAKNSGL